jgi:hypothetical protein
LRFSPRIIILVVAVAALIAGVGMLPSISLRVPLGVTTMPWSIAYLDAQQSLGVCESSGFRQLFDQPLAEKGAAASPTGTHVAAVTTSGELWLVPTVAGDPVLLAEGPVATSFWPDVSPWSADGRALVYVSDGNLFYRRLAGRPRQLTSTGDAFTAALSPDGALVAYGRKDKADKDLGLWVVAVRGAGEPRQLAEATGDVFSACCPHWSPDGQWVAFLQAYEGGGLAVAKADGTDTRAGIEAAWEPIHWLPDSDTVLYPRVPYGESPDGLWKYSVSSRKAARVAEAGQEIAYALSPDGTQAFVAAGKLERTSPPRQASLSLISLPQGVAQPSRCTVSGEPLQAHWSRAGDVALLSFEGSHGQLRLGRTGLTSLVNVTRARRSAGWVHCR